MIIALTGTHRTGKSTLMNAYANVKDIQRIATQVKSVKPAEDDAVLDFFRNQLQILNLLCSAVLDAKTKGNPVILDRTPLDAVGYLLAGAETRGITIPDIILDEYLERAITHTAKIDHIFHVPIIGITEDTPGSFPADSEIQLAVDSHIRPHLLNSQLVSKTHYIPDDIHNLWERVGFVDKTLCKIHPGLTDRGLVRVVRGTTQLHNVDASTDPFAAVVQAAYRKQP